jgi:uncharacterized membrane protein YedE/YeeE
MKRWLWWIGFGLLVGCTMLASYQLWSIFIRHFCKT